MSKRKAGAAALAAGAGGANGGDDGEEETKTGGAGGGGGSNKHRKGDGGILWKIVFPNLGTFKNMIKIVAGVLTQTKVEIIKSDTFEGIQLEALHSSHVCLIIASYSQTIQCSQPLGKEVFSLKLDCLKKLLDEMDTNNVMEMYREVGSPDIVLKQSSDFGLGIRLFTLHTLEDIEGHWSVQDFECTIGIDLEVLTFKSFCKSSQGLGGERMQILVRKWERDSIEHNCLTLFSNTVNASMKREFYCKVQRDKAWGVGEKYSIRAVTDGTDAGSFEGVEDAETLVDQEFSLEYLNNVLKNMDRDVLHLTLSQNTPCVIKYSLGEDKSDIKVVMAPQSKETE